MTLRNRHGQAGRDHGALPRPELVAAASRQVQPGVAGIGLGRDDGVLPEAADRDFDQLVARLGSSASRIRYWANRWVSRLGSRARMKTPSGPSMRSSIGGPSEYSSASFAPSS